MRLQDGRVLGRVVGAAVAWGGEVYGEVGHEGVAGGDIGRAGVVEGLGDACDGFFGLEEGLRGL